MPASASVNPWSHHMNETLQVRNPAPPDRGRRKKPQGKLTLPTLLGFARMGLTPFIAISLMSGEGTMGFYLYVVAALTDAFDGLLARWFNWQSRLGSYVDPLADKVLINTTFLVLALAPAAPVRVPLWLALPVLLRDLIVIGGIAALLFKIGGFTISPSRLGKLAIIAQMTVTALLMFESYVRARDGETLLEPALIPACAVTLVLTLLSGWQYVRRGRQMWKGRRATTLTA
ncbi:MAG: hypothetical protein Kow0059_03150 [Candidatus Sumerlaeia bacterium]